MRKVNIWECPMGTSYARKLNEEITAFIISISDRHQRRVETLTVNQSTMDSINCNGRVFQGYFVYLNEDDSYSYRTRQKYIQHIKMIIDNCLSDGEVVIEW